MAIRFPTTSGNLFQKDSNISTTGLSLFFRVKQHTDRNLASWLGTVGMSGTSAWLDASAGGVGADAHIHGVSTNADGETLEGFAFWDWTTPSLTELLNTSTWYNVAIICSGSAAVPAVKLAIRAHPSGTLYTRTRNDAYFGASYDNFSNARIQIGGGSGGANPSGCDFADIVVYNAAYTSDVDIEAQFDALGVALASPYASYSCRSKASVAAAALDETNSNNMTVIGAGITLIDTDNPTFGATLSGSDTLPSDTSASPPEDPTDLVATVLSSSSIRLDWTDNAATETSYVVESKEGQSETWSLAGSVGPNIETLTVLTLDPDTIYQFRVYASGAGGASGYTETVSATTKKLLARGYAHQSAVSVQDCTVSVWTEKAASQNHGISIIQLDGQAFGSSLTDVGGVDMAVMTVPIVQIADQFSGSGAFYAGDIPLLSDGDDVMMYVSSVVDGEARNTPVFYATVIEL